MDQPFREAGQILAEALAPGLHAAMAGAVMNAAASGAGTSTEFPPTPPPANAAESSPGEAPPQPAQPDNPAVLTPLQRHLICAELDHKVKLTEGALEELTKGIESKWT